MNGWIVLYSLLVPVAAILAGAGAGIALLKDTPMYSGAFDWIPAALIGCMAAMLYLLIITAVLLLFQGMLHTTWSLFFHNVFAPFAPYATPVPPL